MTTFKIPITITIEVDNAEQALEILVEECKTIVRSDNGITAVDYPTRMESYEHQRSI